MCVLKFQRIIGYFLDSGFRIIETLIIMIRKITVRIINVRIAEDSIIEIRLIEIWKIAVRIIDVRIAEDKKIEVQISKIGLSKFE